MLLRFAELLEKPRALQTFRMVDSGVSRLLPADVAFEVQEAINLSATITSAARVNSGTLIKAIENKKYENISEALYGADNVLTSSSTKNPELSKIIEWADRYNLPDLAPYDAMVYKQSGVPRDPNKLIKLRFLLIPGNFGIEYIPDGFDKLPLLQAFCVDGNKIEKIPDSLFRCPSLQRIDLENNNIKRIEDSIEQLKSIHAIDVSGNMIEYLSPKISKLRTLEKFDMRGQRTQVDIMRARNTPMSDADLKAIYSLVERIDFHY